MHHNQAQYYVIPARSQQGLVQQTWKAAGSAVALAVKFREAGHIVEVMDSLGNVLNPERFRGTLFGKRGECSNDRCSSM